MSIPTMSSGVWDRIKDLDPLTEGEYPGCWDISGDIRVLFNDEGAWSLVARDEEPHPPPDMQGLMLSGWPTVKGGTLDEESNIITKNESQWKIHHAQGEEEPGQAMVEPA